MSEEALSDRLPRGGDRVFRVHPADVPLYERQGRTAAAAARLAAEVAARIDEARNPRHARQVSRPPHQRLSRVWRWFTTSTPEPARDENLAALLWHLDHPHTDLAHYHRLPGWLRYPMSVRAACVAVALTEAGWTRSDVKEAQR